MTEISKKNVFQICIQTCIPLSLTPMKRLLQKLFQMAMLGTTLLSCHQAAAEVMTPAERLRAFNLPPQFDALINGLQRIDITVVTTYESAREVWPDDDDMSLYSPKRDQLGLYEFRPWADFVARTRIHMGKRHCYIVSLTSPADITSVMRGTSKILVDRSSAYDPVEFAASIFLHEYDHCNDQLNLRYGLRVNPGEQYKDMAAIKAIESANPASSIAKAVTAYRTLESNGKEGMHLKHLLHNVTFTKADLRRGFLAFEARIHRRGKTETETMSLTQKFMQFVTQRDRAYIYARAAQVDKIANDPKETPDVRASAQLNVDAYEFFMPTSMRKIRAIMAGKPVTLATRFRPSAAARDKIEIAKLKRLYDLHITGRKPKVLYP